MAESAGKNKKRGLGRGLSSLMADVGTAAAPTDEGGNGATRADILVPIERVQPNPDQPRRKFDQEKIKELSASIAEKGLIQPLIVRKSPRDANGYEIVAGERRWRASQLAKLHEIPVIVRDYDDTEVLEVAIIENIQRADLNAIEEAAGYAQLMQKFGHTQEQLAEALGKSRSHIANMMRLMQLPADVQNFVEEGQLSAGHARALITAENPSELAREVIRRGLSVRETERLAKGPKATGTGSSGKPSRKSGSEKDADTRALENDLSAALGLTVTIDHEDETQTGVVSLKYKSLDELDDICNLLSRGRS